MTHFLNGISLSALEKNYYYGQKCTYSSRAGGVVEQLGTYRLGILKPHFINPNSRVGDQSFVFANKIRRQNFHTEFLARHHFNWISNEHEEITTKRTHSEEDEYCEGLNAATTS